MPHHPPLNSAPTLPLLVLFAFLAPAGLLNAHGVERCIRVCTIFPQSVSCYRYLTEIRWNENEGNFNSLRQKTKSDHRQAAEDHIHTVVLNGLVESLKVKPLDSTSFSSVVNLLHALRRINKRQIGSRRSIHPRIAGELPTQNAAPPPPSPPPYCRGRPG